MINPIEIRIVSAKETLFIRQSVLRDGKPLENCSFVGDNELSSLHLGAFLEEKLIGIVSLIKNPNPIFQEKNQVQLRGMAVLPDHRNRHIADKLLRVSEIKLQEKRPTFLWCNARENAVGFYEKFGFTIRGNKFEIPEIGPHFILYKQL